MGGAIMRAAGIDSYAAELRAVLCRIIAESDTEEVVSEVRNHLRERVDELQASGVASADAETRAVLEFGEVQVIAEGLLKGFPPKPPFDPKFIAWIPEAAVLFLIGIAYYSYSLWGGFRGMEAACENLVPASPMFIIPAMFSGLARFKYRRLRPLAVQMRMANYGLAIAIGGTACLVGLQVTGRSTVTSTYPMIYALSALGMACYALMRAAFSSGRMFEFLRQRLRFR